MTVRAQTYRDLQVDLECGRAAILQGPKRGERSTVPPRPTEARIKCECGTTHYIDIQPVVQVVGYRGIEIP